MALDSIVSKTAGRHTKKSRNQKTLSKRWIIILALMIFLILTSVIWWGFVTIKNSLVSKLVDVEPARLGAIEAVVPVEAVLVREEQAISTTQSGRISSVIPEGDRARKGALLARLTVNTIETGTGQRDIPLYAPTTGIVSYKTDGLETIATPDNLEKIGAAKIYDAVLSRLSTAQPAQGQASVQSGLPVIKIYNNLKPTTFIINLAKSELKADLFKPGKIIYGRTANQAVKSLSTDAQQATQPEAISFRILAGTKDSASYLILSSSTFHPDFVYQRRTKLSLITNRYQGYILPVDTIVNKNGQQGVYIVYKESVEWVQVQVKGEVEGQAAVVPVSKNTDRLVPNALIVLNPKLVQEGQPVYVR